jgi:nitroimidazol reductase NimA-like FMN-containing flavoprotein (pyridoxamine 5'-phosphate oxidase superfamily)
MISFGVSTGMYGAGEKTRSIGGVSRMRRKEKEIKDKSEMIAILEKAKYIMLAMCRDDEPYLVTLSHGYDRANHCIYFHCAKQGKKIDILKEHSSVWGQALIDRGYVQNVCDHLYATTHFKGKVTFIENEQEKRRALEVMIKALEDDPKEVMGTQLGEDSVSRVQIGRIDIEYMSGKKSENVVISL